MVDRLADQNTLSALSQTKAPKKPASPKSLAFHIEQSQSLLTTFNTICPLTTQHQRVKRTTTIHCPLSYPKCILVLAESVCSLLLGIYTKPSHILVTDSKYERMYHSFSDTFSIAWPLTNIIMEVPI